MPIVSKTYSRRRGGCHQRACDRTRIGARGLTNISSYRPGFGRGFRHPSVPEVTCNSFPFSKCYQCRSMQDLRLQKSITESADTDLSLTVPKFHQFPLLPVEIQSEIWSFAALHPRTIPILTHWIPPENLDTSISPHRGNAGSINITPLSRIPPLLHTCSSSRAIALLKYRIMGNEPRYLGEDLFDDEYLDENGLLIDGNYEITRGFYINPSVDILYFTSHVEDHYFKHNTNWNGNEPKDLKAGIFAETLHFPVDDVLDLLTGSEIDKEIRYLAFDLDLPGVGHRILGDSGLALSPIGNWTGLERVIFCLGGIDGVNNAAEKDEFPKDSKGKGKETFPVDKRHEYSSSVIDFEKETKLYGIRESFTGPSAGKGNALFKKCISKYSQFSGDLVSQSEEWFECLKPTGSLGVDGRPAVSYTGTLGLGSLGQNGDMEGGERLDILPVIGFGVVSNYISGEERDRCGLEENPFEKMCYDGYVSFEKDEANENSVFGCSVVMGED
ncbi:uncharacterized protein EAF02_007204 [Botrytis sinoallii]|uniref:uncharacterized protein n=1 Tax=Botrytis sinoallii TaxID=1463999 RepID=UPI001901D618|nr:uncharacterized protein EAF02_007204 [Botrytis sinoallii]KAF7880358.1 hypothetical protein EAF02_007204 [Botrytis sinoallii]